MEKFKGCILIQTGTETKVFQSYTFFKSYDYNERSIVYFPFPLRRLNEVFLFDYRHSLIKFNFWGMLLGLVHTSAWRTAN